nr:CotH kinase family protein [Bacteroidales bacterium]
KLTSSNLPIISIYTFGNEIPNEPKINALMGIIYNGKDKINYVNDSYNNFYGKIGIELRGSSSQTFPKKSYLIELRDSSGQNLDTSLLDMPAENDWILYAPYSDKSMQRDVLTYKLVRAMGRYASRTMFCELILNDEYLGVYVLMEKIKRDKNRVNIKKLKETDNQSPDITGGYIIKIDKTTGGGTDGWNSPYKPFNNAWQQIYYQYEYPAYDKITSQQKNYIENYISEFEKSFSITATNDTVKGYKAYVDLPSFIDYFIINELCRNVDAYRLSAFLYKDHSDVNKGKLFAGPAWDYNLAFGNANYCEGNNSEGWAYKFGNYCNDDYYQIPFWWQAMLNDTAFQNQLKCRWSILRESSLSNNYIFSIIDSMSSLLNQAQQRNYKKWQILNEWVWPNYYVGKTYTDEINYLKKWTTERLNWLDKNIPGKCNTITDYTMPALTNNLIIYPNPSKGKFNIQFNSISKRINYIAIYNNIGDKLFEKLYDSPSKIYESIDLSSQPAGLYFIKIISDNYYNIQKLIIH